MALEAFDLEPLDLNTAVNVQGLVTLGIIAIGIWVGYKIFKNLVKA